MQHLAAALAVARRDQLERLERHLVGRRVAEVHVVEVHRQRTVRQRLGVRRLDHQRLEVEHLEDPLERHHRGHDVDPHVGQRGDRAVEPAQQRGQGEQRPDRDVAVHRQDAARAVHEGSREAGHQEERGVEDPAVHGDLDAGVAHPRGALAVLALLVRGPAEQLDQQRAGDVEPLGRPAAELGVELHLLPGQRGQPPAHVPRRQQEHRHQHQAGEGDRPGQVEHRAGDEHQRDEVGDDPGQGRRERLLRAHDVAVDPGHQRAGLGAGEERDRLALHVDEHLGAQVVDQPLADPGGEPALDQADPGVDDRDRRDRQTRATTTTSARLGVTPSSTIDFRISGTATVSAESRTASSRKPMIGRLVGTRVRRHPPGRARLEPLVGDAAVAGQPAHRHVGTCHRHPCATSPDGAVAHVHSQCRQRL